MKFYSKDAYLQLLQIEEINHGWIFFFIYLKILERGISSQCPHRSYNRATVLMYL